MIAEINVRAISQIIESIKIYRVCLHMDVNVYLCSAIISIMIKAMINAYSVAITFSNTYLLYKYMGVRDFVLRMRVFTVHCRDTMLT